MEAEFREIDENGSWSAIYQVGPLGKIKVETDLSRLGQKVANRQRLLTSSSIDTIPLDTGYCSC